MIGISENCIESSQAVFGAWALGGGYWGQQSHSDSVKAIHAAIRGGINHFDTAPVYGKGKAELLIGQQLRKNREKFIIASKCFHKTPESFDKSFQQSLRRLNTNYIDIFYIHWPDSKADMRPVMELLERYRRDNTIRAIGVSNFSINQMESIMDAGTIDIMQCGYNLFWRKDDRDLLPFCKKNNIKTSAYSILGQGILSGKYSEIPQSEEFKHRRKMVLFDEYIFPQIIKEVSNLEKLAKNHNMSSSEASIFWTIENELIDCSILGCRDRKQTEENLKPFSFEKNSQLYNDIETISERVRPLLPVEENIFRHNS